MWGRRHDICLARIGRTEFDSKGEITPPEHASFIWGANQGFEERGALGAERRGSHMADFRGSSSMGRGAGYARPLGGNTNRSSVKMG
jgi:hypothetical protein